MPSFSRSSKSKLQTCTNAIRLVFENVIDWYDCKILEGHRGKTAQNLAYLKGNSHIQWPHGNHNTIPSKATDAVPYPVNWGGPLIHEKGRLKGKINKKNLQALLRFYHFAGFVQGVGHMQGVKLRWGGDWDGDRKFDDQKFNDLPHFEEVV